MRDRNLQKYDEQCLGQTAGLGTQEAGLHEETVHPCSTQQCVTSPSPPSGPPCSHLRATGSEDNAALSSLQASPQAPGQTTGVAGARPTMQPPQSYRVGGQRSSEQLTGKPTGTRPDYRGCWCAVSRGHPGRPNPPSPRAAHGQL
ncbi:UNVERIFIED_CONTAM: hypothetical protein FKN15_014586 [Acipenser sinensis]